MAELFDKISKKINVATDYVAKKTEKFAKDAKLNFNLKKEEADLDECFERLGRAFFAQAKTGVSKNEKIAELILEADGISEKIKNIKLEIAKVNNKKICPHCESVLDKDSPYCSKCGNKIIINEEKESESVEENASDETADQTEKTVSDDKNNVTKSVAKRSKKKISEAEKENVAEAE